MCAIELFLHLLRSQNRRLPLGQRRPLRGRPLTEQDLPPVDQRILGDRGRRRRRPRRRRRRRPEPLKQRLFRRERLQSHLPRPRLPIRGCSRLRQRFRVDRLQHLKK